MGEAPVDVSGWSPFGFEADPSVSLEIAARLHALRPHIVFVCFGAPKSEKDTSVSIAPPWKIWLCRASRGPSGKGPGPRQKILNRTSARACSTRARIAAW